MNSHRIAVIPGDGIGLEVIEAGKRVLEVLAEDNTDVTFDFVDFDWSSERYLKTGQYIPDGGIEELKTFDAIYFGAVGSEKVPDHISLWDLRLKICQGFDQYANVRPARVFPGITSRLQQAEDIDWVIIRENSEGEYSGNGGRVHQGLPEEVGTEVSIFTRKGIERIHRFAFEMAQSRPRKHLTLVTKSNAQRHGMVLWDEIFFEVAKDYPDVTITRELVDAITTRMVLKPHMLDVIVATNLHADIISDLAAALSGSLGIAPTANLNPEGTFPSMFEPIHGSAFDITGKGIANPVGAFWTAVMMLEHLGETALAKRLMTAIEEVVASGLHAPDLGGSATTREITDAVCERVRAIR
ncbi:tartrate dehydrogenase [Cobetia amphilecti]|jgi:tartrate dehydrogenase/decarboxylase/D-malate dehydrogenase|uniref:D-malate dehydrogenase (decarboxylating) n=1 Tax=Cobetia amphilecti TaxID=1055104 RepID=A0ABT6USX8_9GAMM|nr:MULTISPECIES: tartrate dehydrogenase [Cobetia]MBR9800022.1 tartrate dehydrogenase [Gammaproteobacteria bacterium]MBF09308.1 tartrate dehydrogenase [Cobetia sp.]MDI5885817.1 tartrate dehydrogenase [Cobetia amphilecti]WOI24875.1 tartrate dehydrogenase [Cobetia amphilecti]HBJ27848.1 tartrate dehydrogenase [Cobetia sp.]|tara:strand:- start:1422 stop:2486 length:1065 start_codon:yes stop_codon:yes gene_type:complete